MSQAHKGSRLLLRNQIVPVDFSAALFNFNEDANCIKYGDMIVPTGSPVYTLRPQEGKFGGAVAVEEATTNLITNGDFTSLSGWDTFTNAGVSGGSTLQDGWVTLTNPSGNYYAYIRQANLSYVVASGTAHTFSAYIKNNTTGNVGLRLVYTLSGGAAQQQTKVVTLTGSGNIIRESFTYLPTGNTIEIKFDVITGDYYPEMSGNSARTVSFTKLMCEQKTFATSFTNGTRANGSLKYSSSLFNPKAFTINMWVKFSALNSSYNSLFECTTSSTNRFLWMLGTSPNKNLSFWANNASGSAGGSSVFVPSTNQWYMMTITFDGAKYKQFINGQLDSTVVSTVVSDPMGADIAIGGSSFAQSNALIDDVLIAPNAISDEEILAMYISNSPLYNPYDYRGYAY